MEVTGLVKVNKQFSFLTQSGLPSAWFQVPVYGRSCVYKLQEVNNYYLYSYIPVFSVLFFFIGLRIPEPISFTLVTKPGSSCCERLLKCTEEDKAEVQEVTASLAAPKEISMEAALEAELDGVFKFKQERKVALNVFLR